MPKWLAVLLQAVDDVQTVPGRKDGAGQKLDREALAVAADFDFEIVLNLIKNNISHFISPVTKLSRPSVTLKI